MIEVDSKSLVLGLIMGLSIFTVAKQFVPSKSKDKDNEGVLNADDECQSLFYDINPGLNGTGFPSLKSCSPAIKDTMTTVRPEFKRLGADLYKQAVEFLPIVCIDIICKRKSDNKLLLFLRRDKPAANM